MSYTNLINIAMVNNSEILPTHMPVWVFFDAASNEFDLATGNLRFHRGNPYAAFEDKGAARRFLKKKAREVRIIYIDWDEACPRIRTIGQGGGLPSHGHNQLFEDMAAAEEALAAFKSRGLFYISIVDPMGKEEATDRWSIQELTQFLYRESSEEDILEIPDLLDKDRGAFDYGHYNAGSESLPSIRCRTIYWKKIR